MARMIEDPPYPSMGMNLNSDSIINCAKNMGLHSNEPSYVIMQKNSSLLGKFKFREL